MLSPPVLALTFRTRKAGLVRQGRARDAMAARPKLVRRHAAIRGTPSSCGHPRAARGRVAALAGPVSHDAIPALGPCVAVLAPTSRPLDRAGKS